MWLLCVIKLLVGRRRLETSTPCKMEQRWWCATDPSITPSLMQAWEKILGPRVFHFLVWWFLSNSVPSSHCMQISVPIICIFQQVSSLRTNCALAKLVRVDHFEASGATSGWTFPQIQIRGFECQHTQAGIRPNAIMRGKSKFINKLQ